MRVALHTLGCKLNQYETEVIREGFVVRGWEVVGFDEPADVLIVNTCTVTSKADHDARRLLRRARRQNPHALIVASGCYAQTDAELLHEMPEVDLVLGNVEKLGTAELVARRVRGIHVADIAGQCDFGPASVEAFAGHTRAFVKIQDGCDDRCAYCKVPSARGPNRSRPFGDTIEQAQRLVGSGHREIVLIGVHLGTYGTDLSPARSLAELLQELVAQSGADRIRLSSIEPLEFNDELVEVLAANTGRVCRHLHIPLQSGSDAVLRRMNRRYTGGEYRELAARLAERIRGLALGADVIVGFPGETDEDFEATARLAREGPIAYLHVFSFSPRKGTPAADLPERVRPDIIKSRSRSLIELSKAKRAAFLAALVGSEQPVLFEREQEDGVHGLTDTYAQVVAPPGSASRNSLVAVAIESSDGEVCRGRVAARS